MLQQLRDDEPEKYQPESLEALYTSVHAIRADPSVRLTEKNTPAEKRS